MNGSTLNETPHRFCLLETPFYSPGNMAQFYGNDRVAVFSKRLLAFLVCQVDLWLCYGGVVSAFYFGNVTNQCPALDSPLLCNSTKLMLFLFRLAGDNPIINHHVLFIPTFHSSQKIMEFGRGTPDFF